MLSSLDRFGPELAVMVTAGLVLLADLVVPRRYKQWLAALAVTGLGASALWLVILMLRSREASFFSDSMSLDNFSIFFMFLFLAVSATVIVASLDYMPRFGSHQGEFFALLLLATSGMMLLSGARDLVTIFVSLELTSISQFILAGFLRDDKGSEAALKYLLLGAVASAVILYGMAFLFGLSGTTRLVTTDGAPSIASTIASGDPGIRSALIFSMVFLAAGFAFKMSVVPFQMWTPDVYQGAPTPVAAFLSVGSKAAAFAVVIRIFYEGFGPHTFVGNDWKIMFAILAAISMCVGNVMALRQSNIRRMLGYSSIAQAGNFLVGLAAISAFTNGHTQPRRQCRRLLPRDVRIHEPRRLHRRPGDLEPHRLRRDQGLRWHGPPGADPRGRPALSACLADRPAADRRLHRQALHLQCGGTGGLVWLVIIAVLNTAISAFSISALPARCTSRPPRACRRSSARRSRPKASSSSRRWACSTFGVYPIPLMKQPSGRSTSSGRSRPATQFSRRSSNGARLRDTARHRPIWSSIYCATVRRQEGRHDT